MQNESDVGVVFPTFEWFIPASVIFVLNASRGVKWTPGWLPPKGEILPVSEWIIALDDFKTRELAKAWRFLWSWLIVGWLVDSFHTPLARLWKWRCPRCPCLRPFFFFEKSRFGWFDHGIQAEDFGSANFIRGQASFSMEGGYDHPQPAAALMQRLGFTAVFSTDILWILPWPALGIRYMMRDMPDGSMQPSILYNGFLGQVWVGHW